MYMYIYTYIHFYKKCQKDKPQINQTDCLQSGNRAEKNGNEKQGGDGEGGNETILSIL